MMMESTTAEAVEFGLANMVNRRDRHCSIGKVTLKPSTTPVLLPASHNYWQRAYPFNRISCT